MDADVPRGAVATWGRGSGPGRSRRTRRPPRPPGFPELGSASGAWRTRCAMAGASHKKSYSFTRPWICIHTHEGIIRGPWPSSKPPPPAPRPASRELLPGARRAPAAEAPRPRGRRRGTQHRGAGRAARGEPAERVAPRGRSAPGPPSCATAAGTRTLLPRRGRGVRAIPSSPTPSRARRALCEAEGMIARIGDVVRAREAAGREFFARPRTPRPDAHPAEMGAYLAAVAPLLPRRGLAVDAGTGDGRLLEGPRAPLRARHRGRPLPTRRSPWRASAAALRGFTNVTLLQDRSRREGAAPRGRAGGRRRLRVARPAPRVAAGQGRHRARGAVCAGRFARPHRLRAARRRGHARAGRRVARLRARGAAPLRPGGGPRRRPRHQAPRVALRRRAGQAPALAGDDREEKQVRPKEEGNDHG